MGRAAACECRTEVVYSSSGVPGAGGTGGVMRMRREAPAAVPRRRKRAAWRMRRARRGGFRAAGAAGRVVSWGVGSWGRAGVVEKGRGRSSRGGHVGVVEGVFGRRERKGRRGREGRSPGVRANLERACCGILGAMSAGYCKTTSASDADSEGNGVAMPAVRDWKMMPAFPRRRDAVPLAGRDGNWEL